MADLPPREQERARLALRLSIGYVASFAALGVYMQFFPRWLVECRGLTAADAAFVLSAQVWARTVAGPFWSQRVDCSGRPRAVLIGLALASAVVFAGFGLVHDPLALAAVGVAFGCVYPPIHPILDNLALGTAERAGFHFGRVRAVGSATFLCAIVAMGAWLAPSGTAGGPFRYGDVLTVLIAAFSLLAAVTLLLPDERRAPATGAPLRELLTNGRFLVFLLAAGLIQGSHAGFYNLSTNHWHAHGIDELTSGLIWAEGILAEVLLFYAARERIARLRPTTLLMLGAVASVVRWLCFAARPDAVFLFLINWLHAASFACTFLGSLRFIQLRVPAHQQASAQGLLGAASSGVFLAVATMLAGAVYRVSEGGAFAAMAGLAAVGGALALWLRRPRAAG